MANRPWYDQLREHEPLTPDHERDFCPECYRPSSVCRCFPDCYRYLRDMIAPRSDRITARGSDDERAFVRALNANLLDVTARLVFADWLDDHGRSDEAEVVRNRWASPIVTPFRVLPYWRKASFFARLFAARSNGPEIASLVRRLAAHDEAHGPGAWVRDGRRPGRILVLGDANAVLAGIDRWPLLDGEMMPIIRMGNTPLASSTGPR
jgi:uncharacterized protein (TIGR02996 family)